jgi:hypothetical protein
MSGLKYEKLFYRSSQEQGTKFFDGTYRETTKKEAVGVGFRGACQIPGSLAYINGGLISAPILIDPYPHKHSSDEYLAFLGPPEDRYDFDAHIEFTLGLGGEAEKIEIDRPTMVRIPAGLWHCPLDFVRIGRPIFFQAALMQGAFGGTYLLPDGEKELFYNGQINCIMDPDKPCDTCQKCLALDWRK